MTAGQQDYRGKGTCCSLATRPLKQLPFALPTAR